MKSGRARGIATATIGNAHHLDFSMFHSGKKNLVTPHIARYCNTIAAIPPIAGYEKYRVYAGKKKQHKHKLFGPDFPRTFLTLTPGCPGVKKFLPTTGAAGKRTFWCGRPRFSARTSVTRRVVKKLSTKKVCVDFLAPIYIA